MPLLYYWFNEKNSIAAALLPAVILYASPLLFAYSRKKCVFK